MTARNSPIGTSTVRYCVADSPITSNAAFFGNLPFATSPRTRANWLVRRIMSKTIVTPSQVTAISRKM